MRFERPAVEKHLGMMALWVSALFLLVIILN